MGCRVGGGGEGVNPTTATADRRLSPELGGLQAAATLRCLTSNIGGSNAK